MSYSTIDCNKKISGFTSILYVDRVNASEQTVVKRFVKE